MFGGCEGERGMKEAGGTLALRWMIGLQGMAARTGMTRGDKRSKERIRKATSMNDAHMRGSPFTTTRARIVYQCTEFIVVYSEGTVTDLLH